MTSFNLLPAARLARKRTGARLRLWVPLCVGYTVVLTAALGVFYFAWGGQSDPLGSQRQTNLRKIEDATGSIARLRREMTEAQAAILAGRSVGDQADWSAMLAALARQLGDDIVLSECELTPVETAGASGEGSPRVHVPLGRRRYTLRLSGFGRDLTSVSQFVLRLEGVELFDRVRRVRSSRGPFLAGQAVAFQVECSI